MPLCPAPEQGQKVEVWVIPADAITDSGPPGWLTDGNQNDIGDFTADTGCVAKGGGLLYTVSINVYWL